jgi:hypothetical protein
MKKTAFILTVLLLALLLAAGCDLNGTKNTQTNPFIGTWKSQDVSEIPMEDPEEKGRTPKTIFTFLPKQR